MTGGVGARGGLALAVVCAVACSEAPRHAKVPPSTRPALARQEGTTESPARWRSFQQDAGRVTARATLPDGTCLLGTDRGERWLVRPSAGHAACEGEAEASLWSMLEPVAAILPRGSGATIVSASGHLVQVDSPLGPPSADAPPPEPMAEVMRSGQGLVARGTRGSLWRLDDGWSRVEVPTNEGIAALAADEAGLVYALTEHESLRVSRDGARSFTATELPMRIGATGFGRTHEGGLALHGVLGAWLLRSGAPTLTHESIASASSESTTIQPRPGPSARALAERRAALVHDRYHEAVRDGRGSRWALAQGRLGEPLERRALDDAETCDDVRLAGCDGRLVRTCATEAADGGPLTVRVATSRDEGASWTDLATLRADAFADVQAACGGERTVVLGACVDRDASGTRRGCEATRLVTIAGVSAGAVVTSTRWTTESERAGAIVAVSPDGWRVYVASTSTRTGWATLEVSSDGGRAFHAVPVALRDDHGELASAWEQATDDEFEPGAFRLPDDTRRVLTIDPSGTVGLSTLRDEGLVWLTLDPEGQAVETSEAIAPNAALGGVGGRALAVPLEPTDGAEWEARELGDGGRWASLPTPTTLLASATSRTEPFERTEPLPIRCSAAGCVVGEGFVRVGWDGQSERRVRLHDAALPATTTIATERLECEPMPDAVPRSIGRVASGQAEATLPTLDGIGVGGTDASFVTTSSEGEVVLVGWRWPRVGRVASPSTTRLLAPTLTAAPTRIAVRAEGWIVARGAEDETTDIAWLRGLHGPRGSAKLPRLVPSAQLEAPVRATSLDFASEGIVVVEEGRAMWFGARGTRSATLPRWSDLAVAQGQSTQETARWDGASTLALATLSTPTATLLVAGRPLREGPEPKQRSPRDEGLIPPSSLDEFALSAARIGPSSAEHELFRVGDRLGVSVRAPGVDPSAPLARGAYLEATGELGPWFPLPTLASLLDTPRACADDDRSATPRTLAPHEPTEPRIELAIAESQAAPAATFALTGAVVRGTRERPCAEGWHARDGTRRAVALLSGDLTSGWLVRLKTANDVGLSERLDELTATPLACRRSLAAGQVARPREPSPPLEKRP